VPARIDSVPFSDSGFIGGEQIAITVDGVVLAVTFASSDRSLAQVAARINAALPSGHLPIADVDTFEGSLRIQGWRGHATGSVP
jgi:hypothetical protein